MKKWLYLESWNKRRNISILLVALTNSHYACCWHCNICSKRRCYQNSLERHDGPRCEIFCRGPGFYGAQFGSLALALLLLIIIITTVVIRKRNSVSDSALSFEEDLFDFSERGNRNF